ncbi:MAG: hypothetical protein R2741_14815 [Methanolobus sp.]
MFSKDLIRTKSYSLRLRPSGAKKVTEEFNNWMNKKVPYKKQSVMWSYASLLKTRELEQYLVCKRKTLDFSKPVYVIERHDSDEVRQRYSVYLTQTGKKMGFSKGTLHYIKKMLRMISLLRLMLIIKNVWISGRNLLQIGDFGVSFVVSYGNSGDNVGKDRRQEETYTTDRQ